jgi:hypothetical protein
LRGGGPIGLPIDGDACGVVGGMCEPEALDLSGVKLHAQKQEKGEAEQHRKRLGTIKRKALGHPVERPSPCDGHEQGNTLSMDRSISASERAQELVGGLKAGLVGGLDAGGHEGVAGVMDAGWQGWDGDCSSDTSVAPAMRMLGEEGGGVEMPEGFDFSAEEC